MGDKLYLAGLHHIGITQKKLHEIFKDKQNYKNYFNNISRNHLLQNGLTENQIDNILRKYKTINFKNIQKKLGEREVKIIDFFNKEYPELLKEISNPPFLFYLRGKVNNSPKISVVGSRKVSSYGKSVIEKIIPDLSKYFTIISGGAAGCDSLAHISTLNSGNKTISVIGTGIDVDYPVGNKKMYDDISKNGGGVISIFPIGEVGNPYNFPVRNEVVAGLSIGTLIIEAKEKSGTLITANLSLEMGKDLFAIPGDISKSNSRGCNDLIKYGNAKLVTSISDILEEYNISTFKKEPKKIIFTDKLEEEIYNIILLENIGVDEIVKKMGLELPHIIHKLSMLELKMIVKKGTGGKYEIK